MSEELLKELLEETKKQNKIQESIKREMELQNDLILYEMLRDKSFYDPDLMERDINEMTRRKLYARLSDEDRSILERYRKSIDRFSDEKKLYSITTEGFPEDYDEDDIQEFISKMFIGMKEGVCTERELYEYFERVCERSEMIIKLDYFWEEEWQRYKEKVINEDFEGSLEGDILRIYDEEEWEKRRQEKMEEYENRITKAYAEEQKQYE